tara:strand:- start:12304 stop:12624 length:321 start_codon:yes stop_codon:yes gene_type:complete
MPKGREYEYVNKKEFSDLKDHVGNLDDQVRGEAIDAAIEREALGEELIMVEDSLENLKNKVINFNQYRATEFDEYLNDPETGSRAIFKDHEKRLKGLEKKSRNFKR